MFRIIALHVFCTNGAPNRTGIWISIFGAWRSFEIVQKALFLDICFSLQRGGQFQKTTTPQEGINLFHVFPIFASRSRVVANSGYVGIDGACRDVLFACATTQAQATRLHTIPAQVGR